MKSSTLSYSSFYLLFDYIAAIRDLGLALLQPWTNTNRPLTSPALFNSTEPNSAEDEIWLPQVWISEFGNDGYPDEAY